MKGKKLLLVGIFLLLVFLVVWSVAASAGTRGIPTGSDSVPGEVLIGFKPGATLLQMNEIVAGVGGQALQAISLPKARIRRVRLSETTQSATDTALHTLKAQQQSASSNILFVEPNIIRKALDLRTGGDAGILSQSSDPLLSSQWGYYDISANWLPAPTTAAPTIAVIDTGVDYTHPDLLGKVVKGYDYVNADTNPMDDHGHGTHVAGIAAAKANNGYGITGVSWTSKVLAIKALDSQGIGTAFDIALGIVAAANNTSVKVISMSLGGGYSFLEDIAVDYAVNTKGKLLVAAAGNSGNNTPIYPAGLSIMTGFTTGLPYLNKVLAVAAHDSSDCKASFSNYGSYVSISAPGVDILSTVPNYLGTYGFGFDYFSGTSMATPFVSGAAAVAWAKFPTYTNAQIGSLLTTDNAGYYLAGRLVRDDTCWPNDGTTFQRLNLVHVINAASYEACTGGGIYGFAQDAESGEPLAGAKVVAKQGLTVSGTDYVPYIGELNNPLNGAPTTSGYGLFNVGVNPGNQNNNLTISKTGYATPVISSILAPACTWTYAANIPVPPTKPYYWLVITWDYGTSDNCSVSCSASYDSYLFVPGYGWIGYGAGDLGAFGAIPWAKWLWDNDNESTVNLRQSSEAIRIQKILPGTYTYEIDDWVNQGTSTSWGTSGIKAYIYRGSTTPVLVQTITPPAGTGEFWHVCTISGSTITVVNTIDNNP